MLMTISSPSLGTLIFIPDMLHSIVWLEGRSGSVFVFGWSDEMNLIADLLTPLTMDPHVIQTWFLPLSLCSATQVMAVFAAGRNPACGTIACPGLLATARPCCSSSSAEPPACSAPPPPSHPQPRALLLLVICLARHPLVGPWPWLQAVR
jgi:hypothetical protein